MSELLALVEVLKRTEAWLRQHGVDTPRLDAELLMAHVLGLKRLQLYLAHDRPLSPEELAALRALMKRRGNREPLAYILGSRAFHRIELDSHLREFFAFQCVIHILIHHLIATVEKPGLDDKNSMPESKFRCILMCSQIKRQFQERLAAGARKGVDIGLPMDVQPTDRINEKS